MEVQAILFDLDGTLVDSERESAEAMARALLEEQGIAIEQEDRDFVVGRSWVQIHEQLRSRYSHLAMSRDELIAATAAKREDVFAESGLTILPGAREVVARFAYLPLAIVTGSSRVEMKQALGALGLAASFAITVASEDVSTSKPSPDGYLQAAGHLGVDPRACLVVEDSSAGIAAGVAAQMSVVAVGIGNYAGHDQSAAHERIHTLDELTGELVARAMVRRS
ncbi:MAG: HAD family phosphatase [Myxococcales bacterium]|nr:HAD family phosphatase [Myxococcales bacterium]